MKKISIIFLALAASLSLSAKKVKFSVNMSNETVNTTGIHVYGDFQEAAGFAFNWDPGATQMIQDVNDTNIYSVVVDVPAFNVYEYRFLNGDQSYEVEFVPEESRVNGTFDDNRWMYVDSTGNDTSFIGVIPFAANAPVGLNLVVFKVNMLLENVNPNGVHIAGSFQGWDPAASKMITFNDTVYLYQAYLPAGTYQFNFVNGNTSGQMEYVGGACGVNGQRQVVVSSDIALDAFNFASCIVKVDENELASKISLYPNPNSGTSRINFSDNQAVHQVSIADVTGRIISEEAATGDHYTLNDIDPGMYSVTIRNQSAQQATLKLIVQ